MHRTPFTIRELDEVLYKLQLGKNPGVDGLPAKLYRRLPLNLKRHLPALLSDNGRTPRLGQPGAPAVYERRLGKSRQLETHSM